MCFNPGILRTLIHLSIGPGVDPDHLGVALAPDPDPVHVHPPRDAVAPNPVAPLLRKSPLLL